MGLETSLAVDEATLFDPDDSGSRAHAAGDDAVGSISRRVTASCVDGTIIVIIMNLCNLHPLLISTSEDSGQVRFRVYHNR
jgi:hypothetical protein